MRRQKRLEKENNFIEFLEGKIEKKTSNLINLLLLTKQ